MNQRGFLLLEVLIVTLIGVILTLGMGSFYLSTLRFYDQSESQTTLQRQGGLALEEIARQVRRANILTVATCNGVANSLSVRNTSDPGPSCFYRGALAGVPDQLLERSPGGAVRNLLNGASVPLRVSDVSFIAAGDLATISFTLRAGPGVENMAFKASVIKRNN